MTRLHVTGFVGLVCLAIMPNASAQVSTWTVTNPVANTEYYYLNIPIDIKYDWGTGTSADSLDFTLKDPITGVNYGPNTGTLTRTTGSTWIKDTGNVFATKIPAAGTNVTLTVSAKDIFGNVLGTTNVKIKLRPTP